MTLPKPFLDRPIAHRGLHNRSRGLIENGRRSFMAALDAGYGIELDVQLSADNRAVVFHDYELSRLTGEKGPVRQRTADQLRDITLTDSDDHIEDLPSILSLIDGEVPVLIELKDQDGAMGPAIGLLEAAVTDSLSTYPGLVAVMSFNPHSASEMARLAPNVPRGLVTSGYDPKKWPLPRDILNYLRDIPDYDRSKSSFISHEASDLSRPRVAELKQRGAAILCWTIRSEAMAEDALSIADNITFEDYLPA